MSHLPFFSLSCRSLHKFWDTTPSFLFICSPKLWIFFKKCDMKIYKHTEKLKDFYSQQSYIPPRFYKHFTLLVCQSILLLIHLKVIFGMNSINMYLEFFFSILRWNLHIMKCISQKCFIWQVWKNTYNCVTKPLSRIRTSPSSRQVPSCSFPVDPCSHIP